MAQVLVYDDRYEIKKTHTDCHRSKQAQKKPAVALISKVTYDINTVHNHRGKKSGKAQQNQKDISDRMPSFEVFIG